jgi:hypothetical protein
MSQIRLINGAQIVNFITDFTQREGRVRYRIRLHLSGGETLIFADYARFEQYRQAWSNLHQAKESATNLRVRLG